MKNKFLHTILIFVLFNLIFLISAKPVEAGVVNLGPFCSSVFQCYVIATLGIIMYFAWILFLIIGFVAGYKALKTGKLYLGVISILFFALGILTSPLFINVLIRGLFFGEWQ